MAELGVNLDPLRAAVHFVSDRQALDGSGLVEEPARLLQLEEDGFALLALTDRAAHVMASHSETPLMGTWHYADGQENRL